MKQLLFLSALTSQKEQDKMDDSKGAGDIYDGVKEAGDEVVMFYEQFWNDHKEEVIFGAAVVVSTVVLNAIMTKRIIDRTHIEIDWNLGRR